MAFEVPIINHSVHEINHHSLNSLKEIIYGIEGEDVAERTKPILFQEIAEGVLFYASQKQIEIPQFHYFNEQKSNNTNSIEIIAKSYLVNGQGHIDISKNYLINISEFLNGLNNVPKQYQIRPREIALHEMHHIYQWIENPEKIEKDVSVLNEKGIEAWLMTSTEIEAILVANEMQNILSSQLLR